MEFLTGTDLQQHFREGASYVDRLLKGAKPAELPVRRTDKLELVANCCAATIHDIPIPASLLARAGRIIPPRSGYRSPSWQAARREAWKALKEARG
jgi:ABC transporter substrate binding protein